MTIPIEEATDDVSEGALHDRALGDGQAVVLYTSSDCWRGAGVSFVNIARGLTRHGFRPHVVAMCPEVIDEFRRSGLSVTEVPRGRHEAWILRRLLVHSRAGALIVDRAHDLRVGALAVTRTRVALINRYNHFRPKPPTDLLVRVAYRTALQELVFLSTSARERVLRATPFMRRVRSTTIYEGIDVSEFRPCGRAADAFRARFALGGEPFLLAVGALAPEKRYEVLLESVARLGTDAPLVVICGEGPEASRLRRQADAMAIRALFLGRVPQSVLLGAYNAALGLVHVGAVETFGLAVLEAMACARPIIASAGGALPEVLGTDGRCGTLVPVGAVEGITSAIRWLLANPDDAARKGWKARERARDRFSVRAMEDAYAGLVARRTPGAAGALAARRHNLG